MSRNLLQTNKKETNYTTSHTPYIYTTFTQQEKKTLYLLPNHHNKKTKQKLVAFFRKTNSIVKQICLLLFCLHNYASFLAFDRAIILGKTFSIIINLFINNNPLRCCIV